MNKKSVTRNILWNSFGSLFYLAAQWVITIIVTNINGFYDNGILSLAISVSAIFQTVAMFGIRNFQVSDVDEKYSASTYVGFRGISCIAAIILCPLFTLFLGYDGKQFTAIILYMLFRIAECYSDVLYGIAQKKDRLDINGKGFTVKGIVLLISFYLTYRYTGSLNLAILLMAACSLLTTFCFDLVLVKRLHSFKLYDSLPKCFSLLKETLPLFVYLFLFSTLTAIPKVFLEKMYDETVLGGYSSIFAIALLFQMATTYIYTPFVPTFADAFKKRELKKFYSMLLKVMAVIGILAVIAFLLALTLGDWAFSLVYGEKILEYMYLLEPIILSIVLLSIIGFLYMLQVVVRDFKGLIISNLISFASCVVFTPCMITLMKVNGTSYGLIIACALSAVASGISLFIKIKKSKGE
ncbi:MAG: lipopolysaccharide biosynthesis protein [Clostridia bacterium]|nr:lipopolysaccharide biosynthesis protein [Clostridia bacterium]